MLLNKSLEKDEEFRWCAASNCGNGLLNEDSFTNFITCNKCGTNTCIKHRIVWHEGMTCDEYDDLLEKKEKESVVEEDEAKSAAVLKQMKCPSCTVPLEKVADVIILYVDVARSSAGCVWHRIQKSENSVIANTSQAVNIIGTIQKH